MNFWPTIDRLLKAAHEFGSSVALKSSSSVKILICKLYRTHGTLRNIKMAARHV
jgi:hypothetical protein